MVKGKVGVAAALSIRAGNKECAGRHLSSIYNVNTRRVR